MSSQRLKSHALAFKAFICGHDFRRQLLQMAWGKFRSPERQRVVLLRDEMFDLVRRPDPGEHERARIAGLIAQLQARLIVEDIRDASRQPSGTRRRTR